MTIYFSASTVGFYDDAMKSDYEAAGSWPDDVTQISDRWYQCLILGQSEGKVISVNEYGQPVLSEPAPPSVEQLIQEARQKKTDLLGMADAAIAPLSRAVKLGMATDEEVERLNVWERYSVLLSRVKPEEAPHIDWPEVPEDVA